MAGAGNTLVRKLRSAYSEPNGDGLRPYLKQLLTKVPPNGCECRKIISTRGASPSETALFKRKDNKLVPVEDMECLDAGAYVATTPELARLGWHAGDNSLNWKYHVWSVGSLEGVKIARKFGFLGYVNTGFLRRLNRAVSRIRNAKTADISATGHYPISLKFITDLGGKSISRAKSCLHFCGKSAEKANDSRISLLPVKYSLYFGIYKEGGDVRADILLVVASLEAITGKGVRELNSAIKSAQNRIGTAISSLFDFGDVFQLVGIGGNAEKKAPRPAKEQ